jgi:coenzyme F420 hydrogenase subunit beta
MTDETIAQVVKDGLCTGCGTCVALCPNEAIKLTINAKKSSYIPELNEEECNNCGICYEVCPGHEVDFKQLNLEIFGKQPEDILIGNYLNCYIGHSTDYDIQYNSASGGLITQLLIFALEERIIDGALVTRMKKDKPLEPEPFIARTREEIIEASKSKYCPVPANIALNEILESKERERFAVVGLPCHIHGIRKAEQINKKLKEKIVLHIGIFCGHAPNFMATKFLLRQMNIKEEDIRELNYRGEGWPGMMYIELKNGNQKFMKYGECWDKGFGLYFFPNRCTLCCDGVCELADISFGDAWLPELRKSDKIGRSMIISKTKIGYEILQKCHAKRKIELERVSAEKAIESQRAMLNFKKRSFQARATVFNLFGKKIPNYTSKSLKPCVRDYLNAVSFYFWLWVSSKHSWRLLDAHNSIKQVRNQMVGRIGYYLRKLGLIR